MIAPAGDVLALNGVNKSYPGIRALKDAHLTVRKGEVHAVVGENGAGKSTLMHILCGAVRPDSGEILLNGRPVRFGAPDDAFRAGIGMVFQELSLIDGLSVAENIYANRQPVDRAGLIDWERLYGDAERLAGWCGFPMDVRLPAGRLPNAARQVVEILKAVSGSPSLLILDEPTSSLGAEGAESLFRLIARLKESGSSVIYISHNLDEISAVADRVTVLRDGVCVQTLDAAEAGERRLVALMAGGEFESAGGGGRPPAPRGRGGLTVEGLTLEPFFRDISIQLNRGEVAGLAGLVGAGRTEFARTVFGAMRAQSGRVFIDGAPAGAARPADAMKHGIVYVSDDRKSDGLFQRKSLRDNLIANKLRRFTDSLGLLSRREIERETPHWLAQGNVICRGPEQEAETLSGGNQQKLLLSAWTSLRPSVLFADEPTRGVDVRAKTHIWETLRGLAAGGAAVCVISPDIEELLRVSDRIIVFYRGSVAGEFNAVGARREAILACASGLGME